MNIRKRIDYNAMFAALDALMVADLPQMELYCEIGRVVSGRPEKGAAVMAAEYLHDAYPDTPGFSPRNLRRMREFYRTYENTPEVLAQAMTIGWTQNVVILEADLTLQEKSWYIQAVKQFGWSKLMLLEKIKLGAHTEIALDFQGEVCYTKETNTRTKHKNDNKLAECTGLLDSLQIQGNGASMGRKILCYRDSNTYGYDPRSYFGGQYPENVRWAALLEKKGWQVFNRGENGRSIPQRRCEFDTAIQTIKPVNPDIVTIMLGGNDLLQDTSLSAEDCALRMEHFMQVLLGQNWSCKYLLIAPPLMTMGAWVSEKELVKTSQQLGTSYRVVAKRLSVDFADAGEWGVSLAFDGVHFSEEGHVTFAEELYKKLAKLSGDAI